MGRSARAFDNLSQEAKKKHASALNAKISEYNFAVDKIELLINFVLLNENKDVEAVINEAFDTCYDALKQYMVK